MRMHAYPAEPGSDVRRAEGGYALLAILLGAVLLSIVLVKALPREAMSAQRVREERLIDRGEGYSRAIKLYFRENKKYPQELDDLEDTNGVRYLRKRYKDPITGEDEWRLIHVGTDGRFKDSLVYDTEGPEERLNADGRMGAGGSGFEQSSNMAANRPAQNARMDANTYQSLYGTPPPPQPGVFAGADAARQVRQSAAPDNPLQQQNMQFSVEGNAQQEGVQDPANAGLGPDGRPLPADQQQPTDYSNLPPGQVPPEAGQVDPSQGQAPGYALPGSRGSIGSRNNQRGAAGQRPQPGFAQQQAAMPGGAAVGVSADAASMIGRLLTTPRPGGLAGIQGMAGAQQAGAAPVFEEGIAGVASKAEQYGVKVYKGKNNYNEWEFVYDYRQDAQQGGMPGAAGEAGNINPNQPGLSAGGGLSGFPGVSPAMQQIPGMAPASGPDPRQSQFGGASATPRLPSTGVMSPEAQEQQQQTPEPADSNAPEDPTQQNPAPETDAEPPPPPGVQPAPAQSPGGAYQLPRSRFGSRRPQQQ